MPRQLGVVLSERDRQALAYLALARYLTAPQLHSLMAEYGRARAVARRLRRFESAQGGAPLVRRVPREGAGETMWGLTPAGWEIGAGGVPYAVPVPAKVLAPATVRHQELVNEVLIGLLRSLERTGTAIPSLPFRWIAESEEGLPFQVHDRQGVLRTSLVYPDALVEVPGARARYFLEVESGARHVGITTGSVRNSEALVRKLDRYVLYFTGFAEAASSLTWYGKRFPDRLAPEVVVIVHSVARREAVRLALGRWMAKVERVFRVRVITLADAGGVLASLIAGSRAARSDKHFTVSERSALAIRERVNTLFRLVNDHRDAIERYNQAAPGERIAMPSLPTKAIDELRELIRHDLFGEPRDDVRWSSRHVPPLQAQQRFSFGAGAQRRVADTPGR
jgi:hypothetical protein